MRLIGFFIYMLGLFSFIVLAFAYRDYSFQLLFIFLFSTSTLTLGTYILCLSKVKHYQEDSEEDLEVIGKFSLY
ncbi:hypothetical protein M9C83_02445 [SAR86 cluster bacterium]|nr:hypothetical protein M9C83_02445 [SAR86 cluster bacterium]